LPATAIVVTQGRAGPVRHRRVHAAGDRPGGIRGPALRSGFCGILRPGAAVRLAGKKRARAFVRGPRLLAPAAKPVPRQAACGRPAQGRRTPLQPPGGGDGARRRTC